jgi:hypothetical protein
VYRRVSDVPQPPAELVTFDGREFTTAAEWEAAFVAWCTAREAWEAQHPGVDLPERILSECPFDGIDDGLPHAGLWSRPAGEDVVRCAEHGLRPGEH